MVVNIAYGMPELTPDAIDLATLAWLAGASANEHLLVAIRGSTHPKIRNAHGYVFQHLLTRSRTVGELADLLGVTQQAASKVVSELEELGYVQRLSDIDDSRVRNVALTPRGVSVVRRARAARSRLEARLVKQFGAAAINDARRVLVHLLDVTGGAGAVTARRAKPPSD